MPKNVFVANRAFNNQSKRNNFDLSFQNHLTMKFGTLYPVFCKEVVPGDSFKIDSAFGLKFMPLVFPVQSGMRAHMHFFYCRNKNLWKNWENWIQNLEDHVHPYIKQSASFFKTGTLADYLDIPTTVVSSTPKLVSVDIPESPYTQHVNFTSYATPSSGEVNLNGEFNVLRGYRCNPNILLGMTPYNALQWSTSDVTPHYMFVCPSPIPSEFADSHGRIYVSGINVANAKCKLKFWFSESDFDSSHLFLAVSSAQTPISDNGRYYFGLGVDDTAAINSKINSGLNVFVTFDFPADIANFPNWLNWTPMDIFGINITKNSIVIYDVAFQVNVSLPHDISGDASTPYGDLDGQVALNALPFRAYESIYQAYYRNTQNQDFLIGGVPQYNRYNTTTDDGADSTPYHLFQRNYEMDYLTSAFPSPQQGPAPVIGMSALGDITLEDETGITTAHAEVGADGDTITGVTITSPVASQGHRVALAELASAGFTISSFREGNALTRWLEMNMRKGYRYLDFIQGHHNVRPKYNELDMPEFIGGYSRDVQVNSILNQTASPDSDPLGSFAGTANCFGGSRHSISHFCDDYGWIMGILCVTPSPAYSQLLPKHYIKNNPLDYYFNEFSQLGMQPITYEEVCPTQAWLEYQADNNKLLTDTFGYQRPNYDLVAYTDQVHGNFRTDLRNFLLNRVFGSRPELGSEFLQIKPEETNDIFAVTTPDNDTIVGQVVFRVFAKRPIPRVSIPSLGK